ncbi:MAG TPA: metallophosphoesterase [Tepidisphaeraceae bacterium]|nr:metallophosphoesterase [Tepidisphaeraceae bacterium]
MRLLATADLHFNHRHSKPLAEDLIARMNAAGGDVLLVVGDTAVADADELERCLSLFNFAGPKLFVAGNHELWTRGDDSHAIFTNQLPQRVRALGWDWLQTDPFTAGDLTVVGTVGWYDYSFARDTLGIPRRFYRAKVSPGAAERFSEHASLFEPSDDIPPASREVLARWNDGKFVKLHRTDDAFLAELLAQLEGQLESARGQRQVIAAVHHVPFPELLPPIRGAQWDFARAYLGSPKIGTLISRFPNVSHVLCGHSHFPAEARLGPIHAINIGSGYRYKTFRTIDLP